MTSLRFRKELLPSPRHFYEHELGRLSRPSRGYVRCACPLQRGRNKTAFSINLNTGHFHCFSCQADGDMVDFYMAYHGCDFNTAKVALGACEESTINAAAARAHRAERERQRIAGREARERSFRLDLAAEIHADQQIINEISKELQADPDNDSLWRGLELAWRSREMSEREYMEACNV